MCGEVCQFVGWSGWVVFLLMLLGALAWSRYCRLRDKRDQQRMEQGYEQQLRKYRVEQLRPRTTRVVEIGAMRERVEILEEPTPPPENRPGRIRHSNGESVIIDFATLQRLRERARDATHGHLLA